MSWTQRPFDDLEQGASLRTPARTLTETDVVSFSALTRDWHPIHTDAAVAATSRFGERIVHGMLLVSYAVGLLPLDPRRVVAMRQLEQITFKRPATIGTTMHVDAAIAGLRAVDDATGVVDLGLRILDQDDRLLVRGTLSILWQRGPEPVLDVVWP